jgi:ribulose-5-phosphate 4-epimerase/fuculose-1-phosphate aldolase
MTNTFERLANDPSVNWQRLQPLVTKQGRYEMLPELTAKQQVALLCRVLFKEGYNDHIAGHITYRQDDGTLLVNPWELAWDEVTASDILTITPEGKIIDGEWNVTPAINVHRDMHALRHDVRVVIHNHSEWGSVWAAAKRVPGIYDQTSALVDTDPAIFDEYTGAVNNEKEGRAAVEALGEHKWALLANHGVFLVAKDIRQAHLRAITLEWRCRLAWRVEQLGGGSPLKPQVANAMGQMTDGNGFPFLWEAMARREIRLDPRVLE